MIGRSVRRPRRGPGVLRWDPRRQRQTVASDADAAAAPRIDPRAPRQVRDPDSGRIRIDRASPVKAAEGPSDRGLPAVAAEGREGGPTAQAIAQALPLVAIEHPQTIVIAVPDLDRGKLTALDRDLFGAARALADAGAGAVLAAVPDHCRDDLGAAGADRVARFGPLASGSYAPAHLASALVELARARQASHLVFADTMTGGGDVGRRVAARLNVRPAVHVKALNAQEAVSLADAGRKEYVAAPPRVLMVEAGCAEPVARRRHEARELPAFAALGLAAAGSAPGDAAATIIDLGAVKVDRSAVPLTEAELIVSAGAGVSDWDAFHRLAARLGAAEAGSRVVCDQGHLPRDRQVGASGTVVEPLAYLAFGISGAPQHLQGIARCERVVAVNADPHAPMIQRADLAIVGDVQQVMPALVELIEQQARHA